MCLINFRSKEEPEVIVAPRPVSAPPRPLSIHTPTRVYVSPTAPIPLQASPRFSTVSHPLPSPRASQTSYILTREPQPTLPPSPGHVVVIQQRTPRTSGPLTVREGASYSYGGGAVVPVGVVMPVRSGSVSRPSISVQGGHRRSGSLGVERRSGSAVYGMDPRASNTSYRSTRERVVIVDGKGTRREYYR